MNRQNPITLFLAVFLWLSWAEAGDVFIKMLVPNSTDQVMMGDVDTMAKEGHLTEAQAKGVREMATSLLSKSKEIFLSAQKQNIQLGGHSGSYYAERVDKVEIMFDTVQMQDGFGVLAGKTGQISPTAYYNKNAEGRAFIIFPVWNSKTFPVVSTVVPNIDRTRVMLGIMVHEIISVFDGNDANYAASTTALWNFSFATKERSSAEFFYHDKPLLLAGGGSVVGGAGSDLAFITKVLLQGLHGSLLANDPRPALKEKLVPTYELLEKEIESLTKSQRARLSKMILQSKIEEFVCQSPLQNDYEMNRGTQGAKIVGYLVRLCSPLKLEAQLKADPEFFDTLSLLIFQSIASDLKKESK
jgi:hypothetical protein